MTEPKEEKFIDLWDEFVPESFPFSNSQEEMQALNEIVKLVHDNLDFFGTDALQKPLDAVLRTLRHMLAILHATT
jgi:hypothetical protein